MSDKKKPDVWLLVEDIKNISQMDVRQCIFDVDTDMKILFALEKIASMIAERNRQRGERAKS